MSVGLHLLLVSAFLVAWVAVDNFIYYRYVLPVLRQVEGEQAARMRMFPWLRGNQVHQFLGLLAEVDRRPWFAWHLRHRSATAATALTLLAYAMYRMYVRI